MIKPSLPLNEIPYKQMRVLVAERLRQDLSEGRLKAGDWLRLENLAQEYGVSHMPIREAMRDLVAEGLFEHVPYRGTRVVEFSPADIEDLYTIRLTLESRAARAAAMMITAEELTSLAALFEKLALYNDGSDMIEYHRYHRQFHLSIIQASRRTYLIRTLLKVWEVLPVVLWSPFFTVAGKSTLNRDDLELEEYKAILAALKAHDPEAAERSMRAHIEGTIGGVFPPAA